jgi:hypothetical protein
MGVLFAIGFGAFLIVRAAAMPAGFGVYGHYRAGALDDSRARPIRYAGQAACLDCHSDVGETRNHGPQGRPLSCEGCHGPLAAHASDPGTAAAKKPEARTLCLRCHEANPARPPGFRQIDPATHADEGPCISCHTPHAPGVLAGA